ncbi:catechol 2,3-dioxygenase-like lactoylglutathione lyase family enzyme [Sphingomonas kyeonggiensis]|uniref:Catechol 2,3-dioxygenase-like lactoylglutathione lyase family enzyme n=1 Tax=Sphingomonas kyeonggiensis TaxID=1268553 RepID=A0A7W7JZJ1_9SPHN|nr:VOC family protein [Sphingomonas kyeonggiensis]MBB4837675.1 catechol 2,3-dioxygenase-like lactoylglutathione lyase family enzyme [Sphingomonas kyeonggiensis]
MRLNHLDLPVPDIAEARAFFERWLGFRHVQTLGDNGLSILVDGAGLVLVLSRLQRGGAQRFPEGFHIGFHLADEAAVTALHAGLAAEGLAGDPPVHQRGAFAFYFIAPGKILVEIAHRPPPGD